MKDEESRPPPKSQFPIPHLQRQKDRRSRFVFGFVLFAGTVAVELVKSEQEGLGMALAWGFAVWANYVAIVWISRFLT